MGMRGYYLIDFSDEIMPCGNSLPEWAAWLAGPDLDWGRDKGAEDREEFRASTLDFQDDIVATLTVAGWVLSREVPGDAALLAVRFGEGCGWSADSLAGDADDLRRVLDEAEAEPGDQFYVAVATEGPEIRLIFRTAPDGPRLEEMGAVQ